jgi:cytochrome c
MFDTMTMTKVVGATCGSLLVFLLGGWASDGIYHRSVASHGEEHGEGHGETEIVQGYRIETGAEEAPAEAEAEVDFATVLASADAAAGEKVFAKCKACHAVDGKDGTGPHLNGVVGRAKASVGGFAYSAVLTGMAADVWSPENLQAFLENPKGYAPGTKMSFNGLPKIEDRANLIAWLETQP